MPAVAPDRHGRARACGRLASAVALLLLAAPAAAQISQPTQRPTSQPATPVTRPAVSLATSDLIIESVAIEDVPGPTPMTTARVTIRNQGAANAVFPAGSVLVQGDPGQSGGLTFLPLTTPVEYLVAPGGTKLVMLSVGDVCAAGNPGTVVFRVDPANVVRETSDANNAQPVQASSFASGDLRATSVGFSNTPSVDMRGRPGIIASRPADESLFSASNGPGFVLWCPNVVMWRETASPLAAKYGLREVKNTSGQPRVIRLGNAQWTGANFAGAIQVGDLPPGGPYTFSVRLNPDGKIRETNAGNNDATCGLNVWPN